jgi:prophage tail gpP-like protein
MTDRPFRIFIAGAELIGWTTATLERKKQDMTGMLSVEIFFTHLPKSPQMTNVVRGKPVAVYVGGHLAFTGTLDKRRGKGKGSGPGKGRSISQGDTTAGGGLTTKIDKDRYTVTLRARGTTKPLVDSSHRHPTGNMLNAKTRQVTEELIKPWGIKLDWQAADDDMDKARFRDGMTVVEELNRVGNEYAKYMWEGRDGTLLVRDGMTPGPMGEPLILGDNILTFSAEQSEDEAVGKIKVKGQRTKKNIRGRDAVENREKEIEDQSVKAQTNRTIQHYGDGTDEALEKRGKFEADNRAAQSKQCEIEVFHVQSRTGLPWDIANLHYVEVPPEGVFDVLECIQVTYTVDAQKTLKTKLVLAPPPSGGISGGSGSLGALGGLAAMAARAAITEMQSYGAQRRSQLGIKLRDGEYPDPWTGASLYALPLTTEAEGDRKPYAVPQTPPLTLPAHLANTGDTGA